MTSSELLTLWEAGKPLRRAVTMFANQQLKAEWDVALKESAMQTFNDSAQASAETDALPSERFFSGLAAAGTIMNRRAKIMDQMQWNLAEALRRGLLLGVAFEFPRALVSPPVQLSPDHWRGEPHWEKSELHVNGLRFIEVRVLSSLRGAKLLGGDLEGSARKPGRPSFKRDIEAAFHAIIAAEKVNPSHSMAAHYPAIRAWLATHRPSLGVTPDKPDDNTIRKYIRPLIDARARKP